MGTDRPKLSLEALADLQVPKELRISPNGQRVVYSLESFSKKDEHPVSSLWVAEMGIEKSARQITSGVFRDELPRWSADGKYIAFVSDRASKGKSSAIYLLPMTASGGEAYPITKTENEKKITSFDWSPNGVYIAFLSEDEKTPEQKRKEQERDDAKVYGSDWNYQRLRLIHLETRKVRTLIEGNQHVNLFSWSRDSTEIVYTVHQTPDIDSPGLSGAKVQIVTLKTEAARNFIHFPGPISSLVWASPDTIYFIAGPIPQHASTTSSVYEARVKKKQWGSWFGWNGRAVALHRARDCVVARVQNAQYDGAHALGVLSVTWPFSSFFNSAEITAFDSFRLQSSDNFILAITRSGPYDANEVWSVDVNNAHGDGQGYIQLSSHNASVDALDLSRAERITTKAFDGQECDGWLFTARSASAHEPLPTVVLVHAGPFYQTIQAFSVYHNLEVPLLTAAGYAVLCPNYRGSSGPGEKFAAVSQGGISAAGYSDIIAILKKAIAVNLVDKTRVAIGDWSQGGFLSYLAVASNDFAFKAAVCGAGVVDWDILTMTSDTYWVEADLSRGAPRDVYHDTKKDVPGFHESGIRHTKNIKTPFLILHGEEDEHVPVSEAIAFWRGCQRWNVPVEMVLYPREKHLIRERKHLIDMWQRILRFYDLHLK